MLAAPVPVVLDADALTLLVDGSLADRLRRRDAPIVVTPHDREFTPAVRGGAGRPTGSRAALRLAAWMNAVVLLKGDRTVVGTPDGRAYVNPTGTPALATGGTGDVLAGLLGVAARRRAARRPGGGRRGVPARAGRAGGGPGRPGDRARRGGRAAPGGGSAALTRGGSAARVGVHRPR